MLTAAITVAAGAAQAAVDAALPQASQPVVTLAEPLPNIVATPDLSLLPMLGTSVERHETPILLATHNPRKSSSGSKGSSGSKNSGSKGSSNGKTLSGLPWKSGTQCYSDQFESFRGREVDISSMYTGRDSWNGVIGNLRSQSMSRAGDRGDVAIALAMLMNGQKFSDCNSGKLDSTFKEIGSSLSGNLGRAIVRLGWEANGTSYAWSIRSEVEPYKQCFRRLVGVLRKEAPNIQIEWSMRKDNGASAGVHQLYPGNDVVDIIGTSFYDRYPSANTQSEWDAAYRETKQGGPKGLGTWLDFAKSKGKKLALAEWAVSDGEPNSSKDNPLFVENTFEFLKANSSNIAYEAYFNCVNTGADIYMIYPEKNNPKASAKYKELWRKGA